jgi:hypothetical protein
MDCELLCRELVRALRGERSQAALSRHLKYRSNVLFAWENGRNAPTASQVLHLAARSGVDLRKVLQDFYRAPPAWIAGSQDLSQPSAVLQLLNDLRGAVPIAELSRASGLSRFALSRIFKGQAQVKGPEFLLLIHACSRRLLDFVALLVSVERLPSVQKSWAQQQARRAASTRSPWSLAVMCALELEEYRALQTHEPGWLARRLGITDEEEATCLSLLVEGGQVRRRAGRYEPTGLDAVELSEDRELAKERRAWWANVATERARKSHGMAAYNLCAVSKADLQRLKDLQREYLARARAIIAESTPVQAVALVHVQIVDLTHRGA